MKRIDEKFWNKFKDIDYKNPLQMIVIIGIGVCLGLFLIALLKILIPLMIVALFVYGVIMIVKRFNKEEKNKRNKTTAKRDNQ